MTPDAPPDTTDWTIDVVAAGVITAEDLTEVVLKVDAMDEGLRGPIVLNPVPDAMREGSRGSLAIFPDATRPLYRADRRAGTSIGARRIVLGPGCSYKSADDQLVSSFGWRSDNTASRRVHFPVALSIDGAVPPDSVLEALPGRHVSAVLDHPALADPRLVIGKAGLNGSPGDWKGMYVLLPQIDVPLDTVTIRHQRTDA